MEDHFLPACATLPLWSYLAAAEAAGVAVLAVAHRRKGGAEFADDLVLGSRAWTGLARSTLYVTLPEGKSLRDRERLFLVGKSNLAQSQDGLAFSIEDADGVPRVRWGGPVALSADEVFPREGLAGLGGERTAEAQEFLLGLLASGPLSTEEINAEARAEGISPRTLRRARDELLKQGVIERRKQGFQGTWVWGLAEAPTGNTLE